MENQRFLEKLKFSICEKSLHFYLYNWTCPKMNPDKVLHSHSLGPPMILFFSFFSLKYFGVNKIKNYFCSIFILNVSWDILTFMCGIFRCLLCCLADQPWKDDLNVTMTGLLMNIKISNLNLLCLIFLFCLLFHLIICWGYICFKY